MITITSETESLPEDFVRIELLIAQIVREFGESSLQRLSEQFLRETPEAIPTGILSLDLALGCGGIPRGRVTEVFGEEGSGKTTLALQIVAGAQRQGGLAAYIDAECGLAPEYVKLLGVKAEDLYVSQPDTGEQGIEIIEALLRSKCFDVIVVDSVAALLPRAELGEAMWLVSPGLHARLISRALRKLCGLAYRSRTALVFTNQLRNKMNSQQKFVEVTTGGRAIPYHASIRLEMRSEEIIRDERGRGVGSRVKVKVVKNKQALAGKTSEFEILSEAGIDQSVDLLNLCLEHGVIAKIGDWFAFEGVRLAATRDKLIRQIEMHDELRAGLREKLDQKLSPSETMK